MSSINRTIQSGYVCQEPKFVNGVLFLRVHQESAWTTKEGVEKVRNEYRDLVVKYDHVNTLKEVKIGNHIYVEGSIETRKTTLQDGSKRYNTQVIVAKRDDKIELLQGSRPAERYAQASTRPQLASNQAVKESLGNILEKVAPKVEEENPW